MAENPVIGENVLCSVGFPVSLFFASQTLKTWRVHWRDQKGPGCLRILRGLSLDETKMLISR